MRKLFLVASFLIAPLVSAQELHTFSNGEVADAEKINENFNYVLENGGGGCSARQQDNSIVIECTDGTGGVLAGAGTVVVYPTGDVGDPVVGDIQEYLTGDVVFMDANDVIIGPYGTIQDGDPRATYYTTTLTIGNWTNRSWRFVAIHEQERMDIGGSHSMTFYHTTSDCSDNAAPRYSNPWYDLESDKWYQADTQQPVSNVLVAASSTIRRKDVFGNVTEGRCDPITNPAVYTLYPVINEVIMPDAILNMAYPVRVEQLP